MKKLTIGKQITIGFAIILLITAALGCLSFIKMRSVSDSAHKLSDQYAPEVVISSDMEVNTLDAVQAIRSFSFTSDAKHYEQTKAELAKLAEGIKKAKELSTQYPSLVKLKEQVGSFEQNFNEFTRLTQEVKSKDDALDVTRENLNKSATTFVEKMEEFQADRQNALRADIIAKAIADKLEEDSSQIELASHVRTIMNQIRIAVWKAQAERNLVHLKDTEAKFVEIQNCFVNLNLMAQGEQLQKQVKEMQSAADAYRTGVENIIKLWQELDSTTAKCAQIGGQLTKSASEIADVGLKHTMDISQDSTRSLDTASHLSLVGLIVAIILGVILSTLIVRTISNVVKDIAARLSAGAEQTVAASDQISQASQSLAEGASEQAANLEETSASLEEINSMVKRNADAADKAKALASLAHSAAEVGTQDMVEMNQAMSEIKSSSDDIGKIIKTIDEIAFQTNILALNAAVEAARAGEAGMGFAVVADEVRNLARRSAHSAQETSAKITAAIARSERGVQISAKVTAHFNEISSKTREVDQYVGEIATASREQSNGVEQVNLAVTQMDKVTQSNAANAEETASAAEELNAQAESVQDAVLELQSLVGNRTTSSNTDSKPQWNGVSKMTKNGTASNGHSAHAPKQNGKSHLITPATKRGDLPLPETASANGSSHRNGGTDDFRDF